MSDQYENEDEDAQTGIPSGMSCRTALVEAETEIALLKAELMTTRARLREALNERESVRAQHAPTIRPGRITAAPAEYVEPPGEFVDPPSGDRIKALPFADMNDARRRQKKQG